MGKTPYIELLYHILQLRTTSVQQNKRKFDIKKTLHKRHLEYLRFYNCRTTESLKEIFLSENGLFPSQREISFNCSCPDWALMCKHVAAVLYGIGTKLDENPFLFFELRGIDVNKLVDVTIKDHVDSLLEHANMPPTDRVMDDSCIQTLFGLK